MNLQVSLRTGETVTGKHEFEKIAAQANVKIKSFRADNHPFRSKEFLADLEVQGQSITYSGVGAHFQNGVIERAQQTVCSWARAMMMHQLIHWEDGFDMALWPYAMEQAVYIWNHLPREDSGLSPSELFFGVKDTNHDAIKNAKVWGCPLYVLNPKLQDGKKLPKWKAKSRRGLYLGVSPEHSSTVARVLNPDTGRITPQYHVVFDEAFSTVRPPLTFDHFGSDVWEVLVRHGLHQSLDADDLKGNPVPFQEHFGDFEPADDDSDSSSTSVSEGEDDDSDLETSVSDTDTFAPEGVPPAVPRRFTRSGRRIRPPDRLHGSVLTAAVKPRKMRTPKHGKSARLRRKYLAGGNPNAKVRNSTREASFVHGLDWSTATSMLKDGDLNSVLAYLEKHKDPRHGTLEDWHPLAMAAKASSADTPTWEEAMNGSKAKGFWEACKTEVETLQDMDVWDVVDRPKGANVLPSTWAFKVKRFPSGEVKKLKARHCVKGCCQAPGVDYFKVWAPVVEWRTVRLMLILSAALGLATKQVDFTAAFVHAPIDTDVYVELPRGFTEKGKVCKLKKSLYGLKQAPRNFYHHIRSNMEKIGFVCAVDIDPCLFISDKVIAIGYVDDFCYLAREQKDIDEVIQKLREVGFTLDEEDDMAGFLGVEIAKDPEAGTVKFTQRGLTAKIIAALGAEDLPPVSTPADDVLSSDVDGDPRTCTFNYSSVIGMLWYLYGHSRPDLGFAVSQAARFAHSPKRSHELALIRIGQYLKGTIDQGLEFKPSSLTDFKMDVYVDSDFMGLYGREDRTDPVNVKSRTGYVICVNDCPVIWSSKLQESIALSTMMAEYYALSTAMREVLPLIDLVKTVAKGLGINEHCLSTFKTTVWEDNMGALTLANLDPGQSTPRSKFYDVKVHWFRSHLVPNQIEVKKIDTAVQLADMFTKPLTREQFEAIRKLLMGW